MGRGAILINQANNFIRDGIVHCDASREYGLLARYSKKRLMAATKDYSD
jgi:hypothetical protein